MPGLISRFSGKVRQTAQAWLMQLPEHHFLFGTILQLTLADPPLHRPAEAARVLTGIFILQHFQQGRGHQSWSFLQQGNKLDVPDGLKRIFTRPPVTITGFREGANKSLI
ncbi:hypothetical protein STW0522RAO56_40760 [Raoultella planticola]|nr:hypothetical protein STW0522RAO56_40760 [Raoultella planticola]